MQTIKYDKQEQDAGLRLQAFHDVYTFITAGDTGEPEEKLHLFVTAHFAKRKQIDVHKCCSHFRNRLDRVIFRKGNHRLYKALWLEEGAQLTKSAYNTTHAHWLIEIPENVSETAFRCVFSDLWVEICEHRDIRFEYVDFGRGGVHGLINYGLKEFSKGNRGTFIESCSDNARLQKNRQPNRRQQR
ncbi:MAG: hypothetical protein WD071_10840 [Pseudohongiella sp.]|uniref:hypothetical protein n=1 Tax=Pseudohongiella sp. TaxID=1979412 RepID=UPI00349FF402